ncbi:MAG TPA: M28 family metallopeptidase [Gemmatimonadales bacterium]|nr:M28 family metallopeptidase [Gemmatimonadales bacterium]
MTTTIRPTLIAALLLLPSALAAQDIASYQPTADRIIQAALADSSAYDRLGRLVDTFGHRLSGSASLEQAIDWILAEMKKDGLANAQTEPVKVPHWVRGAESVELISPRPLRLSMLGLGGSIGTPKAGITAPVLVVSTFEELEARKAEAKGKIVLFDAPFTTYGETGRYRRTGAVAAARAGAVAVLIRSVGPYGIQTPHTGSMTYDSTVTKIPAAALSMEHAMMLHRMHDRGEKVTVRLKMEAKSLPDAISRNVMGEIVGSEHPEEIVVIGGHIDSWDVGQGAMDDGGGVVAAWEAVKLIQRLGLKPRRTIRVVGWTNEENGFRGATTYAANLGEQVANHVFAIESDEGTFRPKGFSFTGSDAALAILRQVGALLKPIGAESVTTGGGGADIAPLMRLGVPGAGLDVEGDRYFWYHHTDGDTLDKLDPADFARCVAAFAVMAYVVADLPERLPR